MFDMLSEFINYTGTSDLSEVVAAGAVLILLAFIVIGTELIVRFIDIFKRIK